MASRIGLAVIGAGRMGRNHARLIAAGVPELRIVAIGDVDGGAAQALADEIGGARGFTDPIDAISSPPGPAGLIPLASLPHPPAGAAAPPAGGDHLGGK